MKYTTRTNKPHPDTSKTTRSKGKKQDEKALKQQHLLMLMGRKPKQV